MPDDVADMAAARGDARHRRDMVGFQRVLHTRETQTQNSEHVSPARLSLVIASQRVGAKRRPMTGSAKQSSLPRKKVWIASSLRSSQ